LHPGEKMRKGDTARTQATEWNDEWLTPLHIVEALGPFDLDPCAPVRRPWPTAARHCTVEDDGLLQPWNGRVWLNPPHGADIWKWLNRMAMHGHGFALIFARTDTEAFQRFVFDSAHSLLFLKGRVKFRLVTGKAAGHAGEPSVLAAYGKEPSSRLENCGLAGRFVPLKFEAW